MTTLPLIALIFLAAVALCAGLVRGFSGFGAALIFTPLAAATVSPRMAAPAWRLAWNGIEGRRFQSRRPSCAARIRTFPFEPMSKRRNSRRS